MAETLDQIVQDQTVAWINENIRHVSPR
jgi:hypothetical protein